MVGFENINNNKKLSTFVKYLNCLYIMRPICYTSLFSITYMV